MDQNIAVREIGLEMHSDILRLSKILNPKIEETLLAPRINKMFNYVNYFSFGVFNQFPNRVKKINRRHCKKKHNYLFDFKPRFDPCHRSL